MGTRLAFLGRVLLMNASKAATALVLASLLVACNHAVDSHLEPYSQPEISEKPILSEAVRVEPHQAQLLLDRGAEMVGILRLTPTNDGISVAGFEDFRREAPRAVAKVGGSHFTLAAAGAVAMGRHGPPFAAYIVWRVAPERWSELPPELQPRVR